jgi:hypothetical protein
MLIECGASAGGDLPSRNCSCPICGGHGRNDTGQNPGDTNPGPDRVASSLKSNIGIASRGELFVC